MQVLILKFQKFIINFSSHSLIISVVEVLRVMNTTEKSQKQRDILLLVSKISNLLDTGLDNRSLYICIRLIEAGKW